MFFKKNRLIEFRKCLDSPLLNYLKSYEDLKAELLQSSTAVNSLQFYVGLKTPEKSLLSVDQQFWQTDVDVTMMSKNVGLHNTSHYQRMNNYWQYH